MAELRRYSTTDILKAAADHRSAFEKGTLNKLEFMVGMADFRFRDPDGVNWFLEVGEEQWYRYHDGVWELSQSQPLALEGPDLTRFELAITEDEIENRFGDLLGEETDEIGPATEMLGGLIKKMWHVYEGGLISSTDLEMLLMRQYIIDEGGRMWTVGIRSQGWFYFEDGHWVPLPAPPDQEKLLSVEDWPHVCDNCGHSVDEGFLCPECGAYVFPGLEGATEEATAAVLAFMMTGQGTLPEYVADPWDPPESYPDVMISDGPACPACGASNPKGSRFCNQCGTPLACPNCGNVNPPGSRFCNACGTVLPDYAGSKQ